MNVEPHTMPTTMTAITQAEYGTDPASVLRLADVPLPTVGDGEVLVRVAAVGIDRGTWHVMSGLPYPIRLAGFGLRRPKAANPGRSLAGVVEAVGTGVTEFRPGNEVYGTGVAALAEYAVARADRLAPRPVTMTFEQAAAVPVSGQTALQAVRKHGRVQAGQRVLVLGASGGVGTFAVQLAKLSGAEVTGVCSAAKTDVVRDLGADHVLDYARTDAVDGRVRYDVILDIGGNRRLSSLRRALASRGRLVIVGGEAPGRWLGGTDRQLRALALSPFVAQTLGTFVAAESTADLEALRELVDSGRLIAAVDRTYPLARTAEAVRSLIEGRVRGKAVVTI